MAIALFADVHGNLEALLAVKKDIESVKPEKIYFLGDVVGYGPNPIECIEIVRGMADVMLKGNHDDMCFYGFNPEKDGYCPEAAEAIIWTRKKLDEHKANGGEDYRAFLKGLKEGHTDGRNIIVHGSPNDMLNEYILRQKLGNNCITPKEALTLVSKEKKRLFAAHAHDSWVYHGSLASGLWVPKGNDSIILPADDAAVIMIGSAGQPRDGNRDACWVLSDENVIHFRRCSYNVEETAQKIYDNPELDDNSGDRLKEGR